MTKHKIFNIIFSILQKEHAKTIIYLYFTIK
jgi:hypothetical protein